MTSSICLLFPIPPCAIIGIDTVDLILETEKTNKKKIYNLCLEVKNEKN